jgi:hypothetical protein
MGNYSRTSEVQRDLERFEDVAGRTSEVRRDLQEQVDEMAETLKGMQSEEPVTKNDEKTDM